MLALAPLIAALWGCSEAPPELPTYRQAIMSGEESIPELNGVVRIEADRSVGGTVCTGTLAAPNLVITAHHCVAELDERSGFACTIDGKLDGSVGSGGYLGANIDAASVRIFTGVIPNMEPAATAERIIAPFSDTICQNDIAVLVLDRDLDLPLVPLRLDSPTRVGELMTMVGYGLNEGNLASRRQKSGNRVVAVGPSDVNPEQTGSAPRTFMLGSGACKGDSGGPALSDDTGAAVGVFSIIGDACGSDVALTTYTQIAPFAALVREAFSENGYDPVLEELPEDPDLRRSEAGCGLSPYRRSSHRVLFFSAIAAAALLRLRKRSRGRVVESPARGTCA